ncbi:MAG TPA: methyltransferase domain-containing protein [Vicinamibacteria bacterium]|nr:methyltransferase domain-containing protein [Vicinamibacteria bacterium]
MATVSAGSSEPDRQDELGRILERLYRQRFSAADLVGMRDVWHVLVRDFFQPRLRSDRVVVDVGAGTCLFINEVRAARRLALDASPEVVNFAGPGVEAHVTSDLSLREVPDGGAGHVFVSNFLEHLPDYRAVLELLATIRRKLEPGGTLLVLQPNFRLVPRRYFDFIDHQLILTDRSLLEALSVTGFELRELRTRFLPYTSKSFLPKWPLAVSVYLRLRPLQWALAGQTFAVAARPSGAA